MTFFTPLTTSVATALRVTPWFFQYGVIIFTDELGAVVSYPHPVSAMPATVSTFVRLSRAIL